MKNKLVVSALVLGFSFSPISAFADSVTTIQGGNATYSCPPGQQIVDTDKCLTPATTREEQEEVQGQSTPAQPIQLNITGGTYSYSEPSGCESTKAYFYSLSRIPYYTNYPGEARRVVCHPNGSGDFYTGASWSVEYGCASGYTLSGSNCLAPSTFRTISVPVPASTSPAVISGSNGGSLVASVTGFLSPVWNFLTTKLLPAIMALVILGIGVRLSIKAVRKYSKVA